ncbi:MAG: ATP-grasp domain-containing protein, partial [Cytophagales bacterium]|nr:ATP-grasp domain-containing protein [Cytophagales bacterium]
MRYNILVTGCGGDIGQSIGKILNTCGHVGKLYGCDMSDKNAGPFIYKNFFLGISCRDENYLTWLERVVKENAIDLVIPASEPELRLLSEIDCLDNVGQAKLLTASAKALAVGFDKLATAEFLKEHDFPFPVTSLLEEEKERDFPLIVKSRQGSGSSSVFKAECLEEFLFLKKKNPNFIAQEYLDGTS